MRVIITKDLSDIIKEAREALDGTTPGPWVVRQVKGHCIDEIRTEHPEHQQKPHGNYIGDIGTGAGGPNDRFEANARFIAWCREGVPALIARAEAAEAALAAERVKVAKLVEALTPFSEMAGEMFARNWNDDGVAISMIIKGGRMQLTFKEFRAARAAITEAGQ